MKRMLTIAALSALASFGATIQAQPAGTVQTVYVDDSPSDAAKRALSGTYKFVDVEQNSTAFKRAVLDLEAPPKGMPIAKGVYRFATICTASGALNDFGFVSVGNAAIQPTIQHMLDAKPCWPATFNGAPVDSLVIVVVEFE